MAQLNEQQIKIINNSIGKVAVVAGAGAGKTTTNISLITKLHLRDKIPLERMWISTFTNKAGRDLKSKLSNKLNLNTEDLNRLWIGTFHSLGYKYLTQVKRKKLEIILPIEAKNYLKNIYKQCLEEHGVTDKSYPFTDVMDGLSLKRSKNLSWDEVSDYPNLISDIYNLYQGEKTRMGLVDYDDILEMFLEELKLDKDFCTKFDWVFVDECQDNQMIQVELADMLSHKNQVLTGDHKQSIYGFRGASPELFVQKVGVADQVFDLAYNYRSSKDIIDFANSLLEQMPQFKGQELISTKSLMEKPNFIICEDQAHYIYKNIERDIARGIPLEEIAVLGRSIKPIVFQKLQVLLRSKNIPYIVSGGDDKLNAHYIQNYLSVLKSILKPTKVSLTNALSLLPGVGPKIAMKLAEDVVSSGGSFDALLNAKGKYCGTKAFTAYLNLETLSFDKKEFLLRSLDFIHDFYLVPVYSKKDQYEASNKKKIIFESLYNYLMGHQSIVEGIDSLYINEEDLESQKGKLVISTIHKCVTKETLVETYQGLCEINDIKDFGMIATPYGKREYRGKFKKEKDIIFKIQTKKGYNLNSSSEHGISVWDGNKFSRKNAENIQINDLIRLKLEEVIPLTEEILLHKENRKDIREKVFSTPNYLGEDLAELFGVMVGDGTVYHSGFRIVKQQIEVIDRAEEIIINLFKCSVKRGFLNEKTPYLEVNSTFLSRWLLRIEGLSSNKKNVPKEILRSPLRVQKKFIKGLFEDGTVGVKKQSAYIDFKNYKSDVIKKLQVMLLRMGLISTITLDKIDKKGYKISSLYIFGVYAKKFKEDIGLISKCKISKLEKSNFGKADQYIIPFSREESKIFRENFETIYDWQNILYRGYLGREKVEILYKKTQHPLLAEKLSWHYERVKNIEKSFEETYCVEVPDGGRFLQNGIDGWNSKGLEWDSVHIVNFCENSMPMLRGDDEGDLMRVAEEFCVTYVAVTRAKKRLNMYMSFFSDSYDRKPNRISRFLRPNYIKYKEKFFNLRVFDVPSESNYKQQLYNNMISKYGAL